MSFEPLRGVRVVDLTSSLAGPWCTQILAALGAEVVKIEHPERGDEARAWGPEFRDGSSVMFFAANAGKRSLALDVKTDAGLAALLRLAERADVVVQSLRPGRAAALGFGPETLRASNPDLVYCTIGAFGHTGPLARQPGYDPLMQAFGGLISVTGEEDGPGVRAGTSVIDLGTGVWAALAIVAALKEGGGRTLDVSLYETALALLPYQLVDALGTGAVPARHGTAFPLIVPYEVFATRDGELMIAAANDRLYASLCDALDLPELARDPRFATNPDRIAAKSELLPILEERIARDDTATILALLDDAGVPCAPVRDVGEVARDEQTRALGILQDLGGAATVALPLSADGERPQYPSPPPVLGVDSLAVLREAGYSEEELAELVREGIVGDGHAR
jgi:crotonobetainyl-CoA:carnitine CoA-transferase CaiB-like acyl-CoA transferase